MWVIANVLRKHQLPVKAHAHPDRGKQTVSALSDPHTHRTCIRTARKGVSESATWLALREFSVSSSARTTVGARPRDQPADVRNVSVLYLTSFVVVTNALPYCSVRAREISIAFLFDPIVQLIRLRQFHRLHRHLGITLDVPRLAREVLQLSGDTAPVADLRGEQEPVRHPGATAATPAPTAGRGNRALAPCH
jgi:hypothetical protein